MRQEKGLLITVRVQVYNGKRVERVPKAISFNFYFERGEREISSLPSFLILSAQSDCSDRLWIFPVQYRNMLYDCLCIFIPVRCTPDRSSARWVWCPSNAWSGRYRVLGSPYPVWWWKFLIYATWHKSSRRRDWNPKSAFPRRLHSPHRRYCEISIILYRRNGKSSEFTARSRDRPFEEVKQNVCLTLVK